MADSSRVTVNFVIVSSGEALVAKEVDVLVLNTRYVLFGLDMAKAVSFVPSSWEYIE